MTTINTTGPDDDSDQEYDVHVDVARGDRQRLPSSDLDDWFVLHDPDTGEVIDFTDREATFALTTEYSGGERIDLTNDVVYGDRENGEVAITLSSGDTAISLSSAKTTLYGEFKVHGGPSDPTTQLGTSVKVTVHESRHEVEDEAETVSIITQISDFVVNGVLKVGGAILRGVGDPEEPTDAVNKRTLDDAIEHEVGEGLRDDLDTHTASESDVHGVEGELASASDVDSKADDPHGSDAHDETVPSSADLDVVESDLSSEIESVLDELTSHADSDVAHGSNGPVAGLDDVFSGSHDDLFYVDSDDHHPRYTDEEASDAAPVQSFAGRTGAISPQEGDYDSSLIPDFDDAVVVAIDGEKIDPNAVATETISTERGTLEIVPNDEKAIPNVQWIEQNVVADEEFAEHTHDGSSGESDEISPRKAKIQDKLKLPEPEEDELGPDAGLVYVRDLNRLKYLSDSQ